MDSWFEEDEEVFVHAKDPYKRLDALRSSRHIKILLEGEIIAESTKPILLFETGLPTRYYIPKTDVHNEFLLPSALTTHCPYKGEAHYYSVTVFGNEYTDLAWSYRYPTPEVAQITNHVCFPQGKVSLYVDTELEPRPNTRWD